MHRGALAFAFSALLLSCAHVFAADRIPDPKNTPYAGTIELRVDATDTDRRLFRVQEKIPVRPGALTLFYPEWLPGNHAPRGPIDSFAGLLIKGGGKQIAWTRDPVNMYAFHVQVPNGVSNLDLEFQYASPEKSAQGRITMTPEILGVQWEKVLLYPAGYYSSRIQFAASLLLPKDWQYATALETKSRDAGSVRFGATSLETLVDSPLFAGKYFTRVSLDDNAKGPVWLNVVGDNALEIEMKPEQLAPHRKLVGEAVTLFGSRHFDHYEFLLAISDNFDNIGLEHHRSSENGVDRGYFKEWDDTGPRHYLLAHEMTHSWNGKYRRPADLWTPSYNVPMQNSLLWVYEGMTQYWGNVLSGRSGLWSEELTRGAFASVAASLNERRQGREWRNLQDTTHQPIISPRTPVSWLSWQRPEDYYNEGAMIWLDADTKIRELSGDKRSLDDFAKAFFGVGDGSYVPNTYTFEDVVKALNSVQAFDWARFLRDRLDGHGPGAPLDGMERSGWRLVYKDEPNEFTKKLQSGAKFLDLSYSLGLVIDDDKTLREVIWDSPAFKAGLTMNTTLVAVNGLEYSKGALKDAIKVARDNKAPIALLVKSQDRYRTVQIDYTGGLRYPHLERIEGKPDRLSAILKPRT
jgi:predicted metalloprotease with PDZ domain